MPKTALLRCLGKNDAIKGHRCAQWFCSLDHDFLWLYISFMGNFESVAAVRNYDWNPSSCLYGPKTPGQGLPFRDSAFYFLCFLKLIHFTLSPLFFLPGHISKSSLRKCPALILFFSLFFLLICIFQLGHPPLPASDFTLFDQPISVQISGFHCSTNF